MNRFLAAVAAIAAMAGAAAFPLLAAPYPLALGINIASYAVLATAWAMFSGPTRYVSLCSVAFFGIGAYTVAVLGERLPWPAVLVVAAIIGCSLALLVGLATLRLSGVYFVIFTFGLAEMIRQLVTWFEANVSRSVGRHVFLEISQREIWWQLMALTAAALASGWLIARSRLGLALRSIGADEVAARHAGVDTTRTKLALFVMSALFMTVTGAVMAPRWTYIDPTIAFNSAISFQVVIMALLGGAGRWFGPLLGVVPLALLFEALQSRFPNHFALLLGAVFLAIAYLLPRGFIGLYDDLLRRMRGGVPQ